MAKFAAVLGIALMTDNQYDKRNTLVQWAGRSASARAAIFVLLYLEPHNSAILLICMITGTMLVCGGCALRWLPLAAAAGGAGIYLMLTAEGNDVANERLGAWGLMADSGDVDLGWQTTQSLYSIASGGLTGLGIGNSRQKHLWLPEATNDFIFSIVCEELGFLGAVLCIVLFGTLIVQGIFIALRSPDYFGAMLSIGITAQVAWQVFCHIGVVTATLPTPASACRSSRRRHKPAAAFVRDGRAAQRLARRQRAHPRPTAAKPAGASGTFARRRAVRAHRLPPPQQPSKTRRGTLCAF